MNEEALKKILRRLRGRNWVEPNWVSATRTSRYDIKNQGSVPTTAAVERKNDTPPEAPQPEPVVDVPGGQPTEQTEPHIDASGVLIIPFDGPEKYHWWKKGQHVLETLTEVGAKGEIVEKYSERPKNNSRRGQH